MNVVAPAKGATDVPTNARVWVFYDVAGAPDVAVTVRDVVGNAIPGKTELVLGGDLGQVSHQVVVFTPDPALASEATYRIEVTGSLVCDAPVDHTFTTGIEDDNAAAEWLGLDGVTRTDLPARAAVGDCQGGVSRRRFEATGFAPPGDAVAFQLVKDGSVVAIAPDYPVVHEVVAEAVEDHGCYAMQALDVAGNADTNENLRCATGGCSCEATSGHPAAFAWLLAVGAWMLRRRRD